MSDTHNTKEQQERISTVVFSPPQASQKAVQLVEELRNHPDAGVRSGLADVDKYLVPFRKGDLITVIGYTSNLKSTWMDWLGLQTLKTIQPESNKIVIKVTWEQSIEEDTLAWIAANSGISITIMAKGELDDRNWGIMIHSSIKRGSTPLWVVGHSKLESAERRVARPRLTMTDVTQAIEFILNDATDQNLEPALIQLDYLQRIRPERKDGNELREQMMEIVNRSKDLGTAFGCPTLLGIQAKRDVLDRKEKIPTLSDGQETSNIEQSSDVAFGIWYPIKTNEEGSTIGSKDNKLTVSPSLAILRILKQKLGPAPVTIALHVDPERRTFRSMASGWQQEPEPLPLFDAPPWEDGGG